MNKVLRRVLRSTAGYDPEYYDMHQDGNERFFGRLYVERILQHAEAAGIHPPATVLEAGCQAGRLVVPLAQRGFRVTGVDRSGFALRRARSHTRAAGTEATFIQGDVLGVVRRQSGRHYDLVICAEVVYLAQEYREILNALAGAVRPGGLLCVSHRPKFYYLLEALRQYDVMSATDVWSRSEGAFRGSAYFNWQTEDELRALYESLGLTWIAAHPIDRFAWLSGANPSQLSLAQQEQWLRMELESSSWGQMLARYVLVITQRPVAEAMRHETQNTKPHTAGSS